MCQCCAVDATATASCGHRPNLSSSSACVSKLLCGICGFWETPDGETNQQFQAVLITVLQECLLLPREAIETVLWQLADSTDDATGVATSMPPLATRRRYST